MRYHFLRKVFIVIFLTLFQSLYSKLKNNNVPNFTDCEKEFQDNCVKECTELKRTLCYCKDYKLNLQFNHQCLCAADKSECDNELKVFILKFVTK